MNEIVELVENQCFARIGTDGVRLIILDQDENGNGNRTWTFQYLTEKMLRLLLDKVVANQTKKEA